MAFENVVCKNTAILSSGRWVKDCCGGPGAQLIPYQNSYMWNSISFQGHFSKYHDNKIPNRQPILLYLVYQYPWDLSPTYSRDTWVNTLCTESFQGNMKTYLYFLSFIDTESPQRVEIFLPGRQRFTYHNKTILCLLIAWWSKNIPDQASLTHWGQVMHICVGNLTIIGWDNGLVPSRCQTIIWPNAGILLIGPLRTNISEILIEIYIFSFKKMHLKKSSGKWRPFCLGLNVLEFLDAIPSSKYHTIKQNVAWCLLLCRSSATTVLT